MTTNLKSELINDIIDHLEQYMQYSDQMRQYGKGYTVISPFSTESIIKQLKTMQNKITKES